MPKPQIRKKKNDDLLFGTNLLLNAPLKHYKSLKLNLRACDSCWLVIGNHRRQKKNGPLRVHDIVLSVEHTAWSKQWLQEEEKNKENMCDSILKSKMWS